MWRFVILAIITGVAGAQDTISAWYPLQPGNSWIYRKESRQGNMAHPDTESWTVEVTVIRSTPLPEIGGALVAKRTRILGHTVPPGFLPQNDSTRKELSESHLLTRQNCVYILDGIDAQGAACDPKVLDSPCFRPLDAAGQIRPRYRDDLLRGEIPADFCFPMAAGMTWGRVGTTSPAEEYVWRVAGPNGDPFGLPGARTYRLWSHLGSGTRIDRWFQEGVGIVQEVTEHHGTYDENRAQLVRASIGGKSQTYRLTPARTVPLSASDCGGPGWQHFVRSDGMPFRSSVECAASAAHK